jgi:lipopolysaccharide transport system ATP-binding protein
MKEEDVILKVENISKQYRLGTVGTGTISHDFNRFLAKIRGKEDPFLKVGESNDRASKGASEYVWALKDINFKVKKGEVLGIIGENGAGKSTLLKILSKVTAPTTGVIKSKGRIASLLEVGTGFHPEMTGKENVFLNGAILGMTKNEISNKFDEIIEFSGCVRYIDTPVKRYSSGMKVRLAFAVAAFLEPDILVVDEVLAVGDAEFQKKAIGKMQDISKEGGRTVLFVSHNMVAVKNLCSSVIILNNGKVTFEGGTEEAISYYSSSKDKDIYFNPKYIKNQTSNNINIKNIFFTDSKGDIIGIVYSGVELFINIEVQSKKDYEDVSVGIGFYDVNENQIFHCLSEVVNVKYDINGIKIIKLRIPKWPLLKGIYYINAHLKQKEFLLEHLKEVIWINSEKGDYYNTGKLSSWNKGFYIDYDWN